MREIFRTINDFLSQLNQFFNPIGKFYMKIQLLCRVLVIVTFLDDLFGSTDLTCETSQIGCQLTCLNRFAPITHQQLWAFELFCVMLSMVVFCGFNYYNKFLFKRYQKKHHQKNLQNHNNRQQSCSAPLYIVCGYKVMLIFRLACEFFSLYVEYNLSKHISQNADFYEVFQLKESWLCPAYNNPKLDYSTKIGEIGISDQREIQMAVQKFFPDNNRSELFYRDDMNLACAQQQVTVTCWIPFSRMKSLGLKFMYGLLVFQTILTSFELMLECFRPKKSERKIC